MKIIKIGHVFLVLAALTLYTPALAADDKPADIESLRTEAENGDVNAQLSLAKIYYKGTNEVPKNNAESIKWLSKAADKGDPNAQYNLATAYYHGSAPLEKDLVQAHMWLDLILIQKSAKTTVLKQKAIMRNNEIESLMTTEEIAKANSLTQDWIKAHPSLPGQ